VIVWAALPEILADSRIGCIRGVKDVLIGQLLVSIRAAALKRRIEYCVGVRS
jgi:hypothetical protein